MESNKKTERIEELLEHLLAIKLYEMGLSQQVIAKHLKTSKTKVNELLKGVSKGKIQNERPESQNS